MRSNQSRAQFAIIFIWISMVMAIVVIISSYLEMRLIDTGEVYDYTKASANDNREFAVGIISIMVAIVNAVFFIQWFRRAYFNLHQLGASLQYGEGWAAGAWFVPILNLFRPYQIMKEMWETVISLLGPRAAKLEDAVSGVKLLGVWWGLYIAASIADRVGYFMVKNMNSVSDLYSSDIASIVSAVFTISGGFLTIQIIKKYAILEAELPKIREDMFDDFGTSQQDSNWENK